MSDAALWLRKAYPVPANDPAAIETELAAAEHCLRKWQHLRPEVLRRYGLELNEYGNVREIGDAADRILVIDASSCALCARHDMVCSKCSLAQITGQRCTSDSPWGIYVSTNDSEPMIAALQRVVSTLKRERLQPLAWLKFKMSAWLT